MKSSSFQSVLKNDRATWINTKFILFDPNHFLGYSDVVEISEFAGVSMERLRRALILYIALPSGVI